MKNPMQLLGIAAMAASIWLTMPGCSKPLPLDLETHSVDGPQQVRQGRGIEPKSITVWGIYKGGNRKIVDIDSKNITFNRSTPGPQTVKVRVGAKEASFETEVMALRSLTIASLPSTTQFKQGQVPDSRWPGLEVRGDWDQMGSDKIPIASCVVSGYSKDQAGRQTVRVSYEGQFATFDVDVIGMTSIQIAQPPTKRDYAQGDPLDLTGLRVVGVWEGLSERLDLTWDDITGFNSSNLGIQKITVTKGGLTASFDVEVMALTSLELDKPPTKTDYKVGEPLELKGIMVYGNYTGSNPNKKMRVLIPVNIMAVSGYDANRVGKQQKVTITVRGQVANFFVNIEEAAAEQSSGGRRR